MDFVMMAAIVLVAMESVRLLYLRKRETRPVAEPNG